MSVMQRVTGSGLLLFVAIACSDTTSPRRDEFFTAVLTGAAERPNPVTSTADGQFLAAARDTTTIAGKKDSLAVIVFSVNVRSISAATAAHIHAGGPSEAGPVMVFLFSGPATGNSFTGLLSSGEISRATPFTAPFTFDSLLTRMRNGTAYVNVHTTANPGGEIRGQIENP